MKMVVALCALLLASLTPAGGAAAANFPLRTISVYNAWVPGGIVEMSYRPVGDELARILNTNVVLVPSAGAGGLMGVNKALASKADGYNLLLTSDASLVTLSKLRRVRWNLDDFIPLGNYGTTSYGLVVKKDDSRFATLEDFIAYAKDHPGELSCGQSGMLGTEHVGSAMMLDALGLDIKLVPFDGTLPAVAALGSGHIDCAVSPMLYYETVRPLAAFSAERYAEYPALPTFREKGFDVEWGSSYGLFARKGTPPDQVKILVEALARAVRTESVLANLPNVRMNPDFAQGENWAKLMEERAAKVQGLVDAGVIVPEKK